MFMKNISKPIESERLILKELTVSDVSEEYHQWMNDPEITKYMESRFKENTIEKIKEYVAGFEKRDSDFLFMIIEKENGKHIGNIRLGPINRHHKFAEVGVMIGDRESHGRGYGTEAINLIKKYAFEELELHKLTAGCYENNIASENAFLKAGFQPEGRRKKHYKSGDKYVDCLLFGLVNE